MTSIEYGAFYGCSSLSSITIGNSVTSIGTKAFGDCSGLTSVIVGNPSPMSISENTFTNRANATLYVPVDSKSAYQAADYWNEFKAIKEFPDADVNQDGVVNVVDVVDIARYVVDTPSETFDRFLADLNQDATVNVTDAVVLVNRIAGETNWARRSEAVIINDELKLISNADNSLSLTLAGDGQYTAFQVDLHLPADIDVKQLQLNSSRKQKHQLIYNKVSEGTYRIIGLSPSGRTFLGNDGELLNIQLDGFATEGIMIDGIHFVTPSATDVLFNPITLEASGVTSIMATDMDAKTEHKQVYNLNGQRISAPQKGLNIVNGKMILVK